MSDTNSNTADKGTKPSFLAAASVIVFLCGMMFAQIFILEQDWVTHISLLFAVIYAAIIAMVSGFTWDDVQEGILYGCKIAMLPMLILMMVGVLVASWIASGTIPTLVLYGLMLISPSYFLFTTAVVCAIASLVTGSSWTTAATFGVAFMGIAVGLGIPPAMTAGAIITGAVFGDKMSPVSDSTNLAAGIAEANLFDHIRSMVYTTAPALVISLALFFFIGLEYSASQVDSSQTESLVKGLSEAFWITPLTFIPPLIVLIMAVKRLPALMVMVSGCVAGAICAIVLQGVDLGTMMSYMDYGYTADTGIATVDKLLNKGGMQSMMWTISLGFIGLSLGGLLEKTKVLDVMLSKMNFLVGSSRGLIPTHVYASIATNLFSASQFIAIIIPGRMFVPAYRKLKILPSVCSRTCEDSATVTSPLVPWGLGGAYFSGVLGVTAWDYMGWAFLCIITPLIAILWSQLNLFVWREGERDDVHSYNGSTPSTQAAE